MTFSTPQAAEPGRPGPKDTAEDSYTHGLFFRGLAYTVPVAAVLLAAFIARAVFSGTASSDLGPILALFVLSVVNGYQSAGSLLSTFRLTEDRLRQERPLHATKEVSLGEIRRMFIGGQTVEIYASHGAEPDLEFHRKLEGGDELIGKLARRLPEGAEIEHPSGELAGRLGSRS